MSASYGPADFQRETGVSRETRARLERYVDLLTRWQRRINLVSAASLEHVWCRHVLDSAQLLALAPKPPADRRALCWTDLGSGAGFPGLVLAILGAGDVHLIESDARKCAFLREAARVTECAVTVHNARIEALTPWASDVITARALAPVGRILELAQPFARAGTVLLLPRGKTFADELTEACKSWTIACDPVPSRTAPDARILRITDFEKRQPQRPAP